MPTDKQNLDLPARGTTDWHVPLNANFEKLDAAALLQAASVDDLRSNYTPTEETFAFVADDREFWAGTGTEWVRVGYAKQTPSEVYVGSSEPGNADEGDVWIVP